MCRKKLCLNFRSETKITPLSSLHNFWVGFAVHLRIPPNKLCVGYLSEVVLIPIFKLVSSNDYILKQRSKESVLQLLWDVFSDWWDNWHYAIVQLGCNCQEELPKAVAVSNFTFKFISQFSFGRKCFSPYELSDSCAEQTRYFFLSS